MSKYAIFIMAEHAPGILLHNLGHVQHNMVNNIWSICPILRTKSAHELFTNDLTVISAVASLLHGRL